jgi:membrane protein implicated in regulation of membrane protease activity
MWVWVALAVVLGIAEVFTGGLYVLPFGIGAACAAVLELLAPGSITAQWVAFIGISSVIEVVVRRRANRRPAED